MTADFADRAEGDKIEASGRAHAARATSGRRSLSDPRYPRKPRFCCCRRFHLITEVRVPKFHFEVPHSLTAADAKSRVERFAESLQSKFSDKVSDLTQGWNGNTLSFGFKTFGIKITGDITAKDNQLDVNGEIPFTAMMFKGKIESDVKEQLARLMR
jgi:hypothetical protein